MKQNGGSDRHEGSWGGFQYRWNYDEYQKTLQRRRRKNASHGMRTFCLTAAFVFILCFASLVIVMAAALLRGAVSSPEHAADTASGTRPTADWSLPKETKNGNTVESEDISVNPELSADRTNADTQDETGSDLQSIQNPMLGIMAETAAITDAADKDPDPDSYPVMTVNEIAASCTSSTVTIHCKNSTIETVGSGFFVSSDGYIVTNYHVIRKFSAWTVMMYDGTSCDAVLIASSPENDLALLKIEASDMPAVTIGDSDALVIGDEVVAIGTPGSVAFAGTVTYGNISGLNREVPITDESENILSYLNMIQISAVINPGNSGGPLFNVRGEVVGINTMKYVGDGFEGMGFSIPIDTVIDMIDGWIEQNRLENASDKQAANETEQYDTEIETEAPVSGDETGSPDTDIPRIPAVLGIRCEAVTEEEAALYRVPRGVLIRFVEPDSIAEKNGIKSGDILLSANGISITTLEELDAWESTRYIGDTAVICVFRGGAACEITVVFSDTAEADTQQTKPLYEIPAA